MNKNILSFILILAAFTATAQNSSDFTNMWYFDFMDLKGK